MDEIRDNFTFLTLEVSGQVQATFDLLNEPGDRIFSRICSRDDYIDNLKSTVENSCFSRIHGTDSLTKEEINTIRSIHIICVNLERIADFCVNIARQIEYLSSSAFIHRFDYRSMIQEIQRNISRIMPAFDERSLSAALDICRSEFILDTLYKTEFVRIMNELDSGKSSRDLVTTLFIFRYLERIGDSLLNIGEALLFLVLGEKIKINQFDALQQTLSASGYDGTLSEIDFKSIWGSRSGCRISLVAQKNQSQDKYQGIFKEGNPEKIQKEKASLERWETVYPGLTPRIFGYHEGLDTASLLVEFLPGCTLDEVIMTASEDIIQNAMFLAEDVMIDIWEHTRIQEPAPITYIQQLISRMLYSQRLHPGLLRCGKQLGTVEIPSTEELIRKCAVVETGIQTPFTVLCHGDFNANNLVYDHASQRIHYIDVYRSHQDDYVMDAAVFLVSNFRMPVFETVLRDRLNDVIYAFMTRVKAFATAHGDTTFNARMALALSRNFYTSIRFEHHYDFAREMALRSYYLMEKIIQHPSADWNTFSFSEDILFY
ncbi:MAG: phosphotransferase [Deltaproteobacteria bacterium]|nr:phosphotransferase [Deltaproteobacteria bacterium]